MQLSLVLPLRHEDSLHSLLVDLKNPLSPNYRHFLTVNEFTNTFGPSQQDYNTVVAWAKQKGFQVTGTSRNRMVVEIKGSVAQVQQALHVNMGVYQHPSENRTFFAPDREPTTDLSVRLHSIRGLDSFATARSNVVRATQGVQSNATTGSCPGKAFCGSDMRAAYYGDTTLTGAGQTLGLFEFTGTDLDDVDTYYRNAGQTNTVPITLLGVNGASTTCLINQGCDDTEATLDITQALGMAPGMDGLTVYVGKTSPTLDDAGILNAMATAQPLDAQLSCSWSWIPPDPSVDDPFFMEFQAQGQNFFVAAGDTGKWTKSTTFVWPADDPFIISVGGTSLKTTGAGGAWASETAWSDGGGGISPNNFPIPDYQVVAAQGCSSCSQTIRNGPDVSANSDFSFYVCSNQGSCTSNLFGGTSFAAPMWAGYLALANQQALNNGQSTLGFLNPPVYDIGLGSDYNANFHDTTSGSNGFSATVGYDLATGWGSPNGATLIDTLTGGQQSGDFTLSVKPLRISVKRGQSGTATITTTATGAFNSSINLTSGLNAVSFNPATIPAPGTGTSTVTVNVPSGAPLGGHIINITATGSGITHTVVLKVRVTN
jgi:kumamolisin